MMYNNRSRRIFGIDLPTVSERHPVWRRDLIISKLKNAGILSGQLGYPQLYLKPPFLEFQVPFNPQIYPIRQCFSTSLLPAHANSMHQSICYLCSTLQQALQLCFPLLPIEMRLYRQNLNQNSPKGTGVFLKMTVGTQKLLPSLYFLFSRLIPYQKVVLIDLSAPKIAINCLRFKQILFDYLFSSIPPTDY